MRVLRVNIENIGRAAQEAYAALEAGGVVVCPTDTVYGLLADAANKKAVQKVFEIKGRPKNRALPVFVKDIKMAKRLARISKKQEAFLEKTWPGKVTAVLENRGVLPEGLEERGTVALRIPNYELIHKILQKLDRPLTGTSANISGEPACLDGKEVLAQFRGRKAQPDVLLDAGKLPPSKPSMIIDITGKDYTVLRS
ncbi:MAG TPA: threonylcarbamoyl-AMP synthase [Candidatus Wildermuthbacteria bacterium]|uniref:L-threonylcarbamoyladenylate synthase n=1 Tax=Candidatus Yanofskybacteria bacterium GW2011_GWC1_48_11 TaxID=1619027 RepID=A0A837IN41_9BACT|nr:MAG: Sua5/YciO/YrdC/YwlC family protein [Candidatus Yanofskybacteria bacterium GW2011_GWC1_48_11]KKW04015.1 MAG: Sua5/YciO/YrdC/YwlC family protein [Parcubacteria group bacterium GW2011_GWB1_49_12]KKW08884.1 MAG: Sua5/YciO/YrdC/YwlC family protein [Parcubacteria group bacterium GW2011_GWA1_49_26]KKW13738.1 MAG: Sua5/YciO/YrdC/YwlC family protein [Parcubacteria group bacterium GW2011_GWA2_50_10]OHA61804.1 MAG: threonylcarbamoyl-AMP synthase [Candidatus Wildermuthbacteria bacterium GWA1_49_26]